MADYFDMIKESSPSQAELQDQRRRMNQQPAIAGAQATADTALAWPPIGTGIEWYGTGDHPNGKLLLCDGRKLSKLAYPDLYAAIGNTWNRGDEAASEFRIPDRRSRVGVGAGQGELLSNRPLAGIGGEEKHALTANENGAHGHGFTTVNTHNHGGYTNIVRHNHGGDDYTASYNTITGLAGGGSATAVASLNAGVGVTDTVDIQHTIPQDSHQHEVGSSGSGEPHQNMPPFVAVNYLIRALL